MAYFKPPQERPRHVKRFLTVRDVEDAAADGCRQILEAADLVITDAARETAHDLGVAIIRPDPARRQEAASASQPAAAAQATPQQPQPGAAVPAASFAAPAPASSPATPYQQAPIAPAASPTHGFAPPPAHMSSSAAHANEHPLVQDLARAIRARWQPVRRRQRQLLA